MKTQYDKKQNIGMIALFVLSITLTAGLTAKLTKKANDNADKINQVNNNLSNEVDKLNQLVKQDKAVQLYGKGPGICMSNIDASDSRKLEFDASILTNYTMIYFNIHIDEALISQYVLADYFDLKIDGDSTQFYILGGDQCGDSTDALFGSTVSGERNGDVISFTFYQIYIGSDTYQYQRNTDKYTSLDSKDDLPGDTCHFECIYGIK